MHSGTKIHILKEETIMNMAGTSIEEGTEIIDNEKWSCGIGTRQKHYLGKFTYFKKDHGHYIEDLSGFYWPKEILKDKITV